MALAVIGTLRALTWLKWRLQVNSLRGRRQADAMEGASRWLALLVPILLGLFLVAWALALGFGAFFGGRLMAGEESTARTVSTLVRILLMSVLLILAVSPLGRGLRGATGGPRLVLLPISSRLLHLLEVLAGVSDPMILVLLPSLVLLPAGILSAGAGGGFLLAALASLALLALLLSLAALFAFALQWMMRERRRGEVVALVAILLLSCSGLIVAAISDDLEKKHRRERADAGSSPQAPRERQVRIPATFPAWMGPLPSELYGRAIEDAAMGRSAASLGRSGLLGLEAMGIFLISSRIHRRIVTHPAGGSRRRSAAAWPRSPALPGLSPEVSGLALAQARAWMRTVRGRMALLMPGLVLVLMGFALSRAGDDGSSFAVSLIGPLGPLTLSGGLLLALISLQPMLLNQFAADRAGLTMLLLAPMRPRDLLAGKAAAGGLIFLAGSVPCMAGALILHPGGPPALWIASFLGTAGVYVASIPVSAVLSALFPRKADLGEIGQAGNAHPLAGLLSILSVLALTLVPAGAALLGWTILGSPALALGLTILWCGAAFAGAVLFLEPAAAVFVDRLESVGLAAQGR